jgi:hypothetical protein
MTDYCLVLFTGVLALVAVLQLFGLGLQIFTAYTQVRPYVFVEDAKIRPSGTGQPKWVVTYTVKNNGITPAHNVSLLDIAAVTKWRPEKLPTPSNRDNLGSMAPGGDFIDNDAEVVGTVNRPELIAEREAIFLVGILTYRDAFHRKHVTRFCYFIQGRVRNAGEQMIAYDEGNDST